MPKQKTKRQRKHERDFAQIAFDVVQRAISEKKLTRRQKAAKGVDRSSSAKRDLSST
jgi:hypothetical protein